MAAPTPVSAYLHSATMVKAGALLALPQTDLKRLLACSTVSGLGTLMLLLGIGTTLAAKAAAVFLIVHSLYKGALFMVAGAVDHEAGTRDVCALGGLFKVMPITALAMLMCEKSRCSILFHLLVPGGRWQT